MRKIISFLFLFLPFASFAQTQPDSTTADTCKIIVPNAITPNSETNDYLTFTHNCPIEKFHLWIFDRWGNQLYETKDLKNDSWVDWDYSKLSEGVYVWKLECVVDGKKIKKLGNISIIK